MSQRQYEPSHTSCVLSNVTDKILPEVNEWQKRLLESVYPVIYFNGIVFKSRMNSQIINKCVYSVLGIDMNGRRASLACGLAKTKAQAFTLLSAPT
ncbi:transposase [Acididesulfobacillus acetoxydans]|uniref:transposase n=1 Tax=Acididesulfobacillus acetoxydans TaxID=1561005 RepID=UPI001F0FC8E9|nr:transposase [Acididesulfobacillus acetoxydans]